jgi:CubicO group peptidase (beta-lactamase class C family)
MKYSYLVEITTMIIITSIIVNFTAISPIHGDYFISNDYWPTNGWQKVTPEEKNMSSSQINDLKQYMIDNQMTVDQMVIIRRGYLVYEHYFSVYDQNDTHLLYSVTKSFLSALVGIAVKEYGLTLDEKLLDFFPNRTIENPDQRKQNITIEHLLTMTSGFQWNEAFTSPSFYGSDNLIQFMLDRPMAETPGEEFNYCSGNTHLLSCIIYNVTGFTVLELAEDRLFGPLGIEDYIWDKDDDGIYFGGHGLYLRPRDMAKLGYLYLNNGTWDQEQIVTEEWVQESITKYTVAYGGADYGYLWWLYPDIGAFVARGFLGQGIISFPAYDLIVVYTSTASSMDLLIDLTVDFILPALDELPDRTTTPSDTSNVNYYLLLVIVPTIMTLHKKRHKKRRNKTED